MRPSDPPNPSGAPRRRWWGGRGRRAGASPGDREVGLVTVASEVEANIICARLGDAGIPSRQEKSNETVALGGGLQAAGARRVFVREHDRARAAELLGEPGVSDEQLAELSNRAFEDITGHPPPE